MADESIQAEMKHKVEVAHSPPWEDLENLTSADHGPHIRYSQCHSRSPAMTPSFSNIVDGRA